MSDYTTPEGNYTDLDENLAMQFGSSSISTLLLSPSTATTMTVAMIRGLNVAQQ
jgi:hypothetical protein